MEERIQLQVTKENTSGRQKRGGRSSPNSDCDILYGFLKFVLVRIVFILHGILCYWRVAGKIVHFSKLTIITNIK